MAAPLQWSRTSSGDRYSASPETTSSPPLFPSLPSTPSPIQRQNQPQQRHQSQRPPVSFPLRQQRQPSSFLSQTQLAEDRRLQLTQEIGLRKEAENLRLRIKNLDDKITALELKKNLESFGEIADVTVERNENSPRNHAVVLFESRPHDIQGLLKVNIGGRFLEMELLERKNDGRFDYVSANCLELGVKIAQDVFCREFSARSAVSLQFQENRRMIKITFKRQFRDTTIKYQVEMKFHDMDKGCVQIDEYGDTAAITIRLRFPPMYWRYDPKMEGSDPLKWSVGTCLRRVVDIPKDGMEFNAPPGNDVGPVEPNPTNLSAKLGRWTVIRLMVGKEAYRNLEHFRRKCKTYNLLDLESRRDEVQDSHRIPKPDMEAFKNLAFEARYMLESALSFNYIVEYDLTSVVARILCGLEPLKASMILEHIISSRQRVWDLKDYLEREAAKISRISSRPRIVPPQCVYLRKVMVTPTTIHLQPPTVETSNRIIRHFSQLSDYFLRVEFSDEGNNRVWSKDSASNENNAIYNRIFCALTNGIRIGDREYQFLAFSASQLRDNSAWFFCSQGGGNHTVDSIHRWMGNFSHIKSIAKYAARMGQCFSSTRAISTLSASEVEMITDIEYDNHNFSDGCGRISWKLAQMIGNELEKETTPVAFQIRLGGSKGVLVWYPPLREKRVQIRPSMKKFDVAHYVLEVIKTSAFIPSYLNRQIIILLTALGVPDQVILDLKNKMIKDLESIESDDLVAIRMLLQNWDENGTSKMMVTMIKTGFLQRQDPFIKNLLTLFKLQMLEELSKKARIFVPKGAYLLGVCDETGGLKEDEIFVQVSSAENPSKRTIIEGKCVVVRCPCFHPGDIRVVRAVKCPALNHLYDVVVFNTKGTRGIPSMCSGGDLDGDDFTVIWDPNIVNNVKQRAPMDYTGRDAMTSEDVTIRDIKKFFVQYAVSNNLGVIANAHLALSDYLDEGPHHGKCLRLAQLHSDAVDFPKTGKPAWIKPELRPKKYPDFMEKQQDRSYESKRVLGRIYRECSKQETFVPKNYQQSFNRLLLIDGYQEYMNDARRCKACYDEDVRSLMNQYGVRSDLEVVSGYIMFFDVITNKREHDIRKAIVNAYASIRRRFRAELEREFYAPDSKTISPNNLPFLEMKAAAWYAVCYQDLQPGQPYTFAWIAWDHLCNTASRVRITPTISRVGSGDSSLTATVGPPLAMNSFELDIASRAQANMMDLAFEREREKSSLERQHPQSDLALLQQFTQQHLMPGLYANAYSASRSALDAHSATISQLNSPSLLSGLNGLNGLRSMQPNSVSSTSSAMDLGVPNSGLPATQEAPRPVRNEITTQAGFMTIGPDVNDEALSRALGF